MKKRLLSAVLALAMALTLLPMSVFAASPASDTEPESGKTSIQYINYKDNTRKDVNGNGVGPGWIWQYEAGDGKTYWTCDSIGSIGGIVVGTNASGVWYDDIANYVNTTGTNAGTLKGTSFTLLGDAVITDAYLAANSVSGSLSVNLFGHNLNLGGDTVLNRYNSVTITDTWATQYGKTAGTVSNITRNVSDYSTVTDRTSKSASGFTLRVTGANAGAISLTGRGNNVTLTGATATGITMDGTTTVKTQKADGTISSTVVSYPGQTLTINSQAAQPNYGMGVIAPNVTGTIVVTGDGSNVRLTDVKGSSAVTVTSTGGQGLYVDGASNLGAIVVGCGTNATANQAPAPVTINSGTVQGVSRTDARKADGSANSSTTAGAITVNEKGSVGAIVAPNNTVAIHSGTVNSIALTQGSLTIDGSGATVGNVSLQLGGKTTLNVTGTGHTVGDIKVQAGANGKNLTIGSNWPTGRDNTFGEIDLGNYTGQGIKGGIFKESADTAAKAAWFSPDLQFVRKINATGVFAYYGRKELATAIADAGAAASTNDILSVIGWKGDGSGALKRIGFYNSTIDATAGPDQAIAQLSYGVSTAIYLPDKINGAAVTSWTNALEAKTYPINEQQSLSASVPTDTIKLVLQSTGATVSKLTNAESASGSNPNVTVTMNGTQVVLSGAVGQAAYEDIVVKFTTDLIGDNGKPVTFEVPVAYNTSDKTATFSTLGLSVPVGVTVNNNNVVVGNNTYTLNVSGLAKPAPSLKVADMPNGGCVGGSGKKIVVTVNVNMTQDAKDQLITQITTGAEFDWTTSPAMRQAVNSAWATITNEKTLENWVTTVQRAAWNLKNKGTPTEADLSTTGFNEVVLVPYLQMTVTQYNNNGTLTATLVPSYRVEVRGGQDIYAAAFKDRTQGTPDGEGNYVIQAGRALPALNSNLTGTGTDVGVKITFGTGMPAAFGSAYMHQDSAYVYHKEAGGEYSLTHAGKTGLGTIVLNSTPECVTMTRAVGAIDQNGQAVAGNPVISYYDSLQAAVDDTLPQLMTHLDKITVKSNYTGNGTISVSGEARSFDVVTEGNTTIASNANSDLVKVTGTGHEFTVQLLKNNVTTASIRVISDPNANGTAAITSGNVNAKPGEKVTVAVTPKQGYVVDKLNVKTNNDVAVPVTNNGNNTFTFTVPANATRVDVTPVFRLASELPFTDVATTANYYNAVKYCYEKGMILGTTSTTFAPNSTITRAQIVTILWRQAGAPRQTPEGIYKDMPGNSDFYNAVIWATHNNIATGYEDGKFYPDRAINRQELATFLYRYQVNFRKGTTAGSVGNLNGYTDGGQVELWAQPAMRWAVGNGIVSGSNNRLTPKENAPRWQAATAMYMYCNGVLGIV